MYQPIYAWNNMRVGMTNSGIMCITGSTDDSTLWKIETSSLGTTFFNKKILKYAHVKLEGGSNSCSDAPKYYHIYEADLFVFSDYGFTESFEDPTEQIYNKAQLILDPITGKVWNIFEDQNGEGAWIILYEYEIQAVLNYPHSPPKKYNETWRIGKKIPKNFTGLSHGLEWNFDFGPMTNAS